MTKRTKESRFLELSNAILRIVSTRFIYFRKDIKDAYLAGRLDELEEMKTPANMDTVIYFEEMAERYIKNGC